MTDRSYPIEFQGEYLGGHTRFQSQNNIVMLLQSTEISIYTAHAFSQVVSLRQPFLIIPYDNIVGIQKTTSDKIDTLRVLAVGVVGGLLWRKKELFLSLSFMDDIGINQTLIFKMKDVDEAQWKIYDKVAQTKKNKKV